jgi:hypothetical protein
MAEIRTVTTLTAKRDEIERAIKGYEAALAQAHVDLAAINATIACFERTGDAPVTPYFDLHRLFKRGEMMKIAMAAMAQEGALTTVELAERIITVKGFAKGDHVLRKAITYRLVHALRLAEKAGKIAGAGKRKGGVRVWTLATPTPR